MVGDRASMVIVSFRPTFDGWSAADPRGEMEDLFLVICWRPLDWALLQILFLDSLSV